jgi:hypothetical protein
LAVKKRKFVAASLYRRPITGGQRQFKRSGEETPSLGIPDGHSLGEGAAKCLDSRLGRLLPPGSGTTMKIVFGRLYRPPRRGKRLKRRRRRPEAAAAKVSVDPGEAPAVAAVQADLAQTDCKNKL